VVVKAQIHAGGRGKVDGVKLAKTAEEAEEISRHMIGMNLVTHQTGPEGREVKTLYLEEGLKIKQEFYLGIVLDRAISRLVFMASAAGGMDIEEVARTHPEQIVTFSVDPATGIMPHHGRLLAQTLGLRDDLAKQAAAVVTKLYAAFVAKDMSLLEINPLVVTKGNELICLDAKIGFDDNALFRHPDIVALRDLSEEDEKEIEASKYELNYVALDGAIGCMVNGAGLAMTSMDIVKLFGGEPANFLDIGGGAGAEKVAAAMRIILSDPNVKAVLFNIFGGITRGDEVARGILAAMEEVKPTVPMVIRLVGTNAEEGRKLLENANMITAETLADAARKAVAAAKGN